MALSTWNALGPVIRYLKWTQSVTGTKLPTSNTLLQSIGYSKWTEQYLITAEG